LIQNLNGNAFSKSMPRPLTKHPCRHKQNHGTSCIGRKSALSGSDLRDSGYALRGLVPACATLVMPCAAWLRPARLWLRSALPGYDLRGSGSGLCGSGYGPRSLVAAS
jgi:hypothetical protein